MIEHSLDLHVNHVFYRFHFQVDDSRVWVLLLKENPDPTKAIMHALSGGWESQETYQAILEDPLWYITMKCI